MNNKQGWTQSNLYPNQTSEEDKNSTEIANLKAGYTTYKKY